MHNWAPMPGATPSDGNDMWHPCCNLPPTRPLLWGPATTLPILAASFYLHSAASCIFAYRLHVYYWLEEIPIDVEMNVITSIMICTSWRDDRCWGCMWPVPGPYQLGRVEHKGHLFRRKKVAENLDGSAPTSSFSVFTCMSVVGPVWQSGCSQKTSHQPPVAAFYVRA